VSAHQSPVSTIAEGGALRFVGLGPSIKEATEGAARRAVDFAVASTGLGREETHYAVHH
jgi:hypothetical protein